MTLETKINRLREAVDEHQKLDTTLTSYENREFEMWVEDLIALPPKEIDYQMCADAMMKMWIENIITDAEYNKIMDKLNKWNERGE